MQSIRLVYDTKSFQYTFTARLRDDVASICSRRVCLLSLLRAFTSDEPNIFPLF